MGCAWGLRGVECPSLGPHWESIVQPASAACPPIQADLIRSTGKDCYLRNACTPLRICCAALCCAVLRCAALCCAVLRCAHPQMAPAHITCAVIDSRQQRFVIGDETGTVGVYSFDSGVFQKSFSCPSATAITALAYAKEVGWAVGRC
jgi:hypothetical protein